MGFRRFKISSLAVAIFAASVATLAANVPAAESTTAESPGKAETQTAADPFTAIPQEGLVAYYPFTDGSLENSAVSTNAASNTASSATISAGSATASNTASQSTSNAAANISNESTSATTSAPQAAENKGATFGPDRFGNANSAAVFSGDSNCYMEIPDHDAFSIGTTGALTISVWVSPKVLTFRNAEDAGYVHWMGKGVPQQHEWVFRMYNKELTDAQENRPNRMSAYAFNLKGGLGSGSYVQEELTDGEWIHIVARYDIASNTITLFKNGVQKDQDALYDETYGVQVENGTAPVRLGTRSLWSFFEGSIDDLRFYSRALADSEIVALYNEPNPAAIYPDTSSTDTTTVKDSTATPSDIAAADTSNVAVDSTKTPNDSAITAIRTIANSRIENAGAKVKTQHTSVMKSHTIIARDTYKNYRIRFLVNGKTFDSKGRNAAKAPLREDSAKIPQAK